MSFFSETPNIKFWQSMRRYWPMFALFAAEPTLAYILQFLVPDMLGARAITAVPALLAGLYPAALGRAPLTFWFAGCLAWFACTLLVLAFSGGGLAA